MTRRRRGPLGRFRRRVHFLLDAGGSDWRSLLLHRSLVALVVASVAGIVLETVPELERAHHALFAAIETIAVGVFTLEYVLRLWSAPEHTPYEDLHPWHARLSFALSGSALIDLLAIAPFYLTMFLPDELRILVLLRLLRFLKLARYSPGMRSLFAALAVERKALLATMVVLIGLVLLAATAMHIAERQVQPDRFGTIPDAMWWAIVTLTTVGYGDVIPLTVVGRMIAGVTMLMGIMMLALPIGIISQAFAEQIHRREFVVTWGILARVPAFAMLSASEIAEIMNYLQAQTVPAHTLIVQKGEIAHSMYFVTSGEVEVESAAGKVRLGEGHFFGEMALLKKTRRNATVRSTRATKLLVLGVSDLMALMERNPAIRAHIESVAAQRS